MKKEKELSLSLSFGKDGTIYGGGCALDTMLYAFNLTTWDQILMEGYLADARWEAAEHAFKQYDFDRAYRDCLNQELTEIDGHSVPWPSTELQAKAAKSDFLLGDYLQIEVPDEFQRLATCWELQLLNCLREAENTGGEGLPDDLYTSCLKAEEWAEGYQWNIFLHGDRSDEGALSRLTRKLFGVSRARCGWDGKNDTVTFSNLTEDDIRELYGHDLGDGEKVPSTKDIEKYIVAVTLKKASERHEAKKRVLATKIEERKRRDDYRASQDQKKREKMIQEAKERAAKNRG